ncbi:MAG: SAM-dependent methyltransferase [Tissierellia bacterium]|nr:SAM-dependent methyltransferase [Tissierellia bacterium]
MILSSRLTKLINAVGEGESVADIGTDHGYLPWELMKKCSKVIATDISEQCLQKSISRSGFTESKEEPEHRIGDGLSPISYGEVDNVVIAGMGGLLIISILDADLEKAKSFGKLILQPMNASDTLRKWLVGNGFSIIGEDICFDDSRYYEIIEVKQGKENKPLLLDGEMGALITDAHSLKKDFIKHQINNLHEILNKIGNPVAGKALERVEAIKMKICEWENLL